MKVFVGGASVKDAEAIKNIASILEGFRKALVMVVSAMGKTNARGSLNHTFAKD